MLSISSSVTHFFPLNRIPIQLSHKTINTTSDGMINSPLKFNLSRSFYTSLDDGLIRGMWYEGISFVVILVEIWLVVGKWVRKRSCSIGSKILLVWDLVYRFVQYSDPRYYLPSSLFCFETWIYINVYIIWSYYKDSKWRC